jgi:hypothetical protein
MRRVLFYLSLLVCLWLVVGRELTSVAIDMESKTNTTKRGILIIIPVSLLLAAGYIIFFRKTFPKGWAAQKKRGQIGIGIIILVLVFGVTIAGTITLDVTLPHSKKELRDGIVVSKYTRKSNKSKEYIVRILFLHAGGSRDFLVSRNFYDRYDSGDHFSNWFYTGPFGTIYTYIGTSIEPRFPAPGQ